MRKLVELSLHSLIAEDSNTNHFLFRQHERDWAVATVSSDPEMDQDSTVISLYVICLGLFGGIT